MMQFFLEIEDLSKNVRKTQYRVSLGGIMHFVSKYPLTFKDLWPQEISRD